MSLSWAMGDCAGNVKSADFQCAPWGKPTDLMLHKAAKLKALIVLVKGGGEMATGVAHRLARSGFRVCLTEIPEPQAVRREVAFCEAVFEGQKEVEGLVAKHVLGREEILRAWERREIPIIVDPKGTI